MTKLRNKNTDKTQKLKLGQNSKTQIVTKTQNLIYDKTQNLKMTPNLHTIVKFFLNLNLQQNSRTQILTTQKL